ncbi:type II toxin-antitoxin system VapC family toxin [Zoogloea sp.]|uniref:type II toxin-antitoxin system VapC family toxin n=1 Tax=Zoogloea sp. TaxID=49181 RepID=UPI0026335C01|nr:type II toxin-antitoxin system VapC family toxin [uncultured Zoogloea sp.]MCK6388760.1 type II toxin-antitoxin system VapC family toxin [Zoogloea sp.]
MYLLDTNVVSELRKGGRANPGLMAFFADLRAEDIYLSVQTIGELRRGVENIRNRGDLPQADRLEAWLDVLTSDHASRILDFDLECAQLWGKLMSPNPQHPIDKQIAAIGLIYDLTVVTRNTADFQSSGVRLLNPFN